MVYTEHAKWKMITHYDNGITVKIPNTKKIALDLGLKVAGAAVMYGLGRVIGEAMDYTPYLNEWIPQAVNCVSGIDIKGNLGGLVGLIGAVSGLNRSGTETFEDDPNKLEKIKVRPFEFTLNR